MLRPGPGWGWGWGLGPLDRPPPTPRISHLNSGLNWPEGGWARAGQGRPLSPCWGGGWGAGRLGTAPPACRRFKRLLRGSERGRSRSPSEQN